MADGRRILITGIAGQLQALVVRALEQRGDVERLVGVDVREPPQPLASTRFVRADLRNPVIGHVLDEERIDTVLHLSTTTAPGASGGRARMKEHNVIGAMQLFAACQRAPTLRRIVLKSTTAVYGSEHTDPVSFREDTAPRTPPGQGFGKDAIEVETYLRAVDRQRDDLEVTILRFANLLGAQVDSTFLSLFSLPAVPMVLGFDPRLQFCHEHDAAEILARTATASHPGVFNVAGDGVLYLSQCIRLAGRVPAPIPAPLVSAAARSARRTRRVDIPADQLRFLRYGRVVDLERMHQQLGFHPTYSTRAAFEDFVTRRRLRGRVGPTVQRVVADATGR